MHRIELPIVRSLHCTRGCRLFLCSSVVPMLNGFGLSIANLLTKMLYFKYMMILGF